ncbi:hypothetical protein BDR26DRAFT_596028 [Obelidium mucronatum]|nr:hypothetical protein BDR26DRAFT_596028 [Obelidium mucronatum]
MYGIYPENAISDDNVKSLLATACFFNDQSLCKLCVSFVQASLNSGNASTFLLFADSFCYGEYSKDLLEVCLSFLCRNAATDRACLSNLSEEWLVKILGSNFCFVESERKRYDLIKTVWAEREGRAAADESNDPTAQPVTERSESRQRLVETLSKCVIFSQMSISELVGISEEGLIQEDLLMKAHWRRGQLSAAIQKASIESTKLLCPVDERVFSKSALSSVVQVPIWNQSTFEPYRIAAVIPANHFQNGFLLANNESIAEFFYAGSFWQLRTHSAEGFIWPSLYRCPSEKFAANFGIPYDPRPQIGVKIQFRYFRGNKVFLCVVSFTYRII